MSRSWDQFHYTRGGDWGGEYTSDRAGMRYPEAGRFTKTLTHRIERRAARLEIEQQLQEVNDDDVLLNPWIARELVSSTTLFVVQGTCLDVDSNSSWLHAVYRSRVQAESRVQELEAFLHVLYPQPKFECIDTAQDALRRIDPEATLGYHGAMYRVVAVPVAEG